MSYIEIIENQCTGCGLCIKTCPYQAIVVESDLAAIDENTCTLCGACVDACPFEAIRLTREQKSTEDPNQYSGVWVFAEQRHGEIHPVVYELLGIGKKLASARHAELSAVLIGSDLKENICRLFQYGADTVYMADHKVLDAYLDDVYCRLLCKLIRQYRPEIVLAGATAMGRALIPRVATTVGTGLTADCTGLEIDQKTGLLLQTRPAFGGNVMARIICEKHRPQMATVRPKVMETATFRPQKNSGHIIEVEVDDDALVSTLTVDDVIRDVGNQMNITDAEIIVAGGRGLKGPEHFSMLTEMAQLLNGAVGATRPVVDAGWISYSHQIGQTGKTVKPKFYFAVGISGAVQHLVGMSSAEKIIAINKNPEAPIFKVADYGLVGDLFEIVPNLTKRIKEMIH